MLTRFIQVKSCIRKAMIDVKSKVQLKDAEIDTIEEIVLDLKPVNLAVEALCHRETNLISADAALQFALLQLEKQHSELAKKLVIALCSSVQQRRTDFSGIHLYLNNPNAISTDKTFTIPKSSTICKIIFPLLQRLDHDVLCKSYFSNGEGKSTMFCLLINDYICHIGQDEAI